MNSPGLSTGWGGVGTFKAKLLLPTADGPTDAALPPYLALFIGLLGGARGHLWVGVPHPNLLVP